MARPSEKVSRIENDVAHCRICPRLVAHREGVAETKIKRFMDDGYWGRAVPSFGDRRARLLIVGLAPAAHGANRTGRMFTGDRSGDWMYRALHTYAFANQAESRSRDDGLVLDGAYITAIARCAPPANKPTREEIESCRGYLVRELAAMPRIRVVVALGRIAFDGFLAVWRESGRELSKPKPRFAHGADTRLAGGVTLLASYHPSQQNTFTGRLTVPMFHSVFKKARTLVDAPDVA
jgi:uracil-DNA glycosylase family 4